MTGRERLLDELRPVAFAIAYRMLGSVSEAEDVVQEALLRVHQALDGGEQIASPRAFVATVTTRLAINELRSARARRERYVGEWLPEPIITDGQRRSGAARGDGRLAVGGDAGAAGEPLARAASGAAACTMCSTTTTRRSRRSSARARTMSVSSRREPDATSSSAGPASRRRASSATSWHRRFFEAAEQGDLAGLEAMLAHDVELTGDGGGKVAGARAVAARAQPCRAHADQLAPPGRALPGVSLRPVEVNGGPGALFLDAQQRLIASVGARYRRRSDHKHQRDRQPRQADAPRPSRRPQIATEVGKMNSGSAASPPCIPARGHRSRRAPNGLRKWEQRRRQPGPRQLARSWSALTHHRGSSSSRQRAESWRSVGDSRRPARDRCPGALATLRAGPG